MEKDETREGVRQLFQIVAAVNNARVHEGGGFLARGSGAPPRILANRQVGPTFSRNGFGRIEDSKSGKRTEQRASSTYLTARDEKGYEGSLSHWNCVLRLRPPSQLVTAALAQRYSTDWQHHAKHSTVYKSNRSERQ